MALRNPVAVHIPNSNVDAHLMCGVLQDAGIEAAVVEDVSHVGVWIGGLNSVIHKPQVWVEREDVERASALLAEYDRRAAERWAAEQVAEGSGSPIVVVCEACGKRSEFPAVQRGQVENCLHCRAYVDVGDDVGFEGWDVAPGEES